MFKQRNSIAAGVIAFALLSPTFAETDPGAKVAFEKYFLGKVRKGKTEPYYEKAVMSLMGLKKLKA